MIKKIKCIDDIYTYCKENNIKMLSPFDADFWEVYNQNHDYFDRLFRNSYRDFVPFSLDTDDEIADYTTDWIFDVYAFLMANEKRYSELWRMQELSDTDYSILDNYNVRETHSLSGESNKTDTMAARQDSKTTNMTNAAQTISETNSYTHGAVSETDGETTQYGQDSTTKNSTINTGAQSNTREEKVSADNVSTYSPKDYTEDNFGTRQDTTTETDTRAGRTDTKNGTHTEQSRTDNESKQLNKGAHNDSVTESSTTGAHTDTHRTVDSENKTITRRGNIGVFSASKLLEEHRELWTAFNFYKLIFDEIANEFLRIIY